MTTPDFNRIPWRKLHTAPPEAVRADWLNMPWQARGLYWLLLSTANREGVIELGRAGLPAVSGLLGAAWSELEQPMTALLASGWAEHDQSLLQLRLPYFEASQESVGASAFRQRRYRDKKESGKEGREGDHPERDPDVTKRDSNASITPGYAEKRDSALPSRGEERIENRDSNKTPKPPQGVLAGLEPEQPKNPKPNKAQVLRATAIPLLAYLSEARKRIKPSCDNLQPLPSNLKHIEARLAEGFTPDKLRHVIDVWEAKCRRQPESFQYFTPKSPFLASNIAGYVDTPLEDVGRGLSETRSPEAPINPAHRPVPMSEARRRALEERREELEHDDSSSAP